MLMCLYDFLHEYPGVARGRGRINHTIEPRIKIILKGSSPENSTLKDLNCGGHNAPNLKNNWNLSPPKVKCAES